MTDDCDICTAHNGSTVCVHYFATRVSELAAPSNNVPLDILWNGSFLREVFPCSQLHCYDNQSHYNQMAVLCGMLTIQYSARSARLYLIGVRGSLGPPESSTQTTSRLLQPFLQGSIVRQIDRQTNRPRYSVGNNRPHIRT